MLDSSINQQAMQQAQMQHYRALSSLFVKNLSLYETSLYIPSWSDTYHLNLTSHWLGHRLGHNPQIRLLRYAVSMFSPIHKPTLKGEQNDDQLWWMARIRKQRYAERLIPLQTIPAVWPGLFCLLWNSHYSIFWFTQLMIVFAKPIACFAL